jgi:hypothetical protein
MNRNKLLIIAFLLFFVITGIVFFLTETSKIKPAHPNLIAWYKFDEGKGTKVRDYSGYRNNGAIYGVLPGLKIHYLVPDCFVF